MPPPHAAAGLAAVPGRPAPRVVSLLPSATEILVLIGGRPLLVGRSHECDFPPDLSGVPVVTASRIATGTSAEIHDAVQGALGTGGQGLYQLDAARIAALGPDVILTQDLCEVCSVDLGTVERLAATLSTRPAVVSLNPASLADVLDDVLRVGTAVGLERAAEDAVVQLRERYWSAVDFVNGYVPGPEVAVLEWTDPPFVAGHWTPALVEAAGGRHSIGAAGARSRQVTPDELLAAAPERVVICPCGLDLPRIRKELPALLAQPWWAALPAVRSGRPENVMVVDGNQMFSRPGPRLVDAFRWLVAWLQERPELSPPGFPAMTADALLAAPV